MDFGERHLEVDLGASCPKAVHKQIVDQYTHLLVTGTCHQFRDDLSETFVRYGHTPHYTLANKSVPCFSVPSPHPTDR